ncbi:protein artichoke [Anabrus simplex]|uniref:protein artichoke n=1 Tax=Anabrus simplex TaxID=316456 RepID=UPI0035A2693C
MGVLSSPAPRRQLVLLLLLLSLSRWSSAQDVDTNICPPEGDIRPCRCTMRGDDLQIWCSHSDLPQVLSGLQAVGKHLTRSVDELILENNYLPSLPGRVFSPLRVIRLMLRDNGLERVAASWLAGLEDTLLELFVVEPRLRSLPADSLEQLHGLEAITLQGGVMKRVPRFTGLARLRYLQIQSPALLELSPTAFRSLPDLEQFHVVYSPHVTRLDAGLLHDLPRLRLLNITSCGLTWIHPRALARLPSLTDVAFPGNRLTDAGTVGRAVRDLQALAVLRLDDNLIEKLGEASFVDMPSLREIYMSGNRITEIQRGAFHRVPALRKLELSRNRIRRVHPEAFLQRSDSGVEELWLMRNALGHVDELRSLLDALPRLRFLDISYNYIEDVPFGGLRGHPTLEQLHLDHNLIQRIEREAFTAMPALRELRLRNNSLNTFLEGPFWNLPSLKGLDLAHNYLRHLDGRLVANLPSLRRLDLSNNEISDVDGSSFLETPALEHVNLSGNALVSVHPITFRGLINLYEVDLGWNRLRSLPALPRALELLRMPRNQVSVLPMKPPMELPHLRMFDLTGNGLQHLQPGVFSAMPQLRTLRLGENALQRLEEGSLSGLSRLEVLDLHDNRLHAVHSRCLRDTKQLRVLDLRGNRLDSVHPDLLREVIQLQRLDLSRNQLTEIPTGTLDYTRELQELDASRNALSEFPMAVSGLPVLELLDLSHNRLSALPPTAMESLGALSELRLARNRLQMLTEGVFRGLSHLAFLDLAGNELQSVARGALHALPELRAVRMGHNRLVTLPEGALNELPRLRIAELQHNSLADISGGAFTNVPHLLLLNLSHNELTTLDHAGLRNLASLEVLDLSHNKLARVPPNSLAGMEWLVELKMDNNNICNIQGSPFNGMPRLRVLSLRNNRMTTLREPAFQKLRSNVAVLDVAGNPLSCSCSMLWLQAWLRDVSDEAEVGPRCADGSLLKEMRLSRQECKDRSTTEPVQPAGCETDAGNSVLGTSQVLSTWMEVKDSTPNPHGAPSPEESEYFYDEYVDYQYEDGNSTSSSNASSSNLVAYTTPATPTLVPVQTASPAESNTQPQVSSHYITGDTPTFYAGTRRERNKTQVEPLKIPQPGIPNNSGLTFFGIPLPSLNLGSLWGSARKADSKPGEVKFIGARGKVQMLPPSAPEVQSGGFVPMMPETGGFVPIVNPLLMQNRSHGAHLNTEHHIKVNYSSWDRPMTNRTIQLTNLTSLTSYEHNFNTQRGPLPIPTSSFPQAETPSTLRSETKTSFSTTSKPTSETTLGHNNFVDPLALHSSQSKSTTTPPKQLEITTINTERENSFSTVPQSLNELIHKSLPNMPSLEMTHIPSLETELVSTGRSKPDITAVPNMVEIVNPEHSTLPTTTESDPWNPPWLSKATGSINDSNKSTGFPADETTFFSSARNIIETTPPESSASEASVQRPSSLSQFLIPGGQQPQFRPSGGRPTITKVTVSPPSVTADPPLGPEPVEEYLRGPVPNTNPRSLHSLSNFKTEPPQNTSMDWYFKNYNRTNLEPYVGPGKTTPRSHSTKAGFSICVWLLMTVNLV